MISAVRLAVSGLLRAPGRTLIRILVLTASVALLGGMLLFVGNSLRTVAGSAVRRACGTRTRRSAWVAVSTVKPQPAPRMCG